MPCAGKVLKYQQPGGPGVRVDSHVYAGYVIPPYYDSLVAKVITHAENRMGAIRKMIRALEEFQIEGVKTTLPLLLQILMDPKFQEGKKYATNYLEQMLEGGKR